MKNPKCQFELRVVDNRRKLLDAYEWCLNNLPLTDERSIIYQVTEIFIITGSQRVINKINAEFGSNFSFYPFRNYYFIDGWTPKPA